MNLTSSRGINAMKGVVEHQSGKSVDGYAYLAAAVIKSGVVENDWEFVESDWFLTLCEIAKREDLVAKVRRRLRNDEKRRGENRGKRTGLRRRIGG